MINVVLKFSDETMHCRNQHYNSNLHPSGLHAYGISLYTVLKLYHKICKKVICVLGCSFILGTFFYINC